ncbi:MAG TPA: hypothetical protein VM264_06615 [Acidimicrobiales bacterium]|nr:hypothetical protein [Acidimicrobiales bacterium]
MTGIARTRRGRIWAGRRLVAALALAAAAAGLPAAGQAQSPGTVTVPAGGIAEGLSVVGHSDLGGEGLNGEVAVIGNTAIVTAGYVPQSTMQQDNNRIMAMNVDPECTTPSVKVVDLSDPARPRVSATIPLAFGQAAEDVDALHVSTPAFTGDLVAIALASCAYDAFAFATQGQSQVGSFAHRGVVYYDVSDRERPRFLGRYFADQEIPDPAAPPCGPRPEGREAACANDQFSVALKRLRDGRIMSVSTRPAGTNRNFPTGDVRIVDVTDPTKPGVVGFWPALGAAPVFNPSLSNGCYSFAGARYAEFSADGSQLLIAYWDGGLYTLDVNNLADPTIVGNWRFPDDWKVEGNAAQVTETTVGGRRLALLSEEDWVWPTTTLRVDSPASVAGEKPACQDLHSYMDRKYTSQIYRRPNAEIPAEIVYVGRGCPARTAGDRVTPVPPDPLLADPAGRIVITDRAPRPELQPAQVRFTTGCRFVAFNKRMEDLGSVGAVFTNNNARPVASAGNPPVGWPREPLDQDLIPNAELNIPSVQISQAASNELRSALCPGVANGVCSGGQRVTGALVDGPGDWGGLRILDNSDPGKPVELAHYRTANARLMPPPDYRGIYSVHHALAEGDRAYVAWNSDGLRVLDLANPSTPVEIASFVPPDTADPTGTVPAKAFVTGVATTARHVVISDMNSGLWVLTKPGPVPGNGYWLAGADGGVFALGNAAFHGSAGALRLTRPIVGIAATPTGKGYHLVAGDGGVFAFGDAEFKGSTGGRLLNAPIVGMAPTPTGGGYWLVASDGGVFSFGDARFHGSLGATRLNRPIVAMAATPGGRGYWLFAADGGVFAFGDARFVGSAGGLRLASPIVGAVRTVSGRGYWLTARDGGVFAFGDAPFAGSLGGRRLPAPVTAIAGAPGSQGYWLASGDGGVYAQGAPFAGSLGGNRLAAPIIGLAAPPR